MWDLLQEPISCCSYYHYHMGVFPAKLSMDKLFNGRDGEKNGVNVYYAIVVFQQFLFIFQGKSSLEYEFIFALEFIVGSWSFCGYIIQKLTEHIHIRSNYHIANVTEITPIVFLLLETRFCGSLSHGKVA